MSKLAENQQINKAASLNPNPTPSFVRKSTFAEVQAASPN